MTTKEAIKQVLSTHAGFFTPGEILEFINQENLKDWSFSKTPCDTVQAQLGLMVKESDEIIRIKNDKGNFIYSHIKHANKNEISLTNFQTSKEEIKNFHERDLHFFLSSFLFKHGISSKTIYHEESNRKDEYQKWVHPDMVGVSFTRLENTSSEDLMKLVDKNLSFDLYSYELKKSINTDYELKKAYFQALSNSSWANYGYLVVFKIDEKLLDELQRLHNAFGIGVIQINCHESKFIFSAKHKNLDFKTIDKLSSINPNFKDFIKHVEKILSSENKYLSSVKKDFQTFCDVVLNDEELLKFGKNKGIE